MISFRQLYAGLVLAIVLNLAIAVIAWPFTAANLTAVVLCGFAIWIIRNRERFHDECR